MKGDDLFYECCLGPRDVSDPLARHWLGQKTNEVTRVTGFHCHADFAIRLEAADPRSVARARIDHHERSAPFVDLDSGRWNDTHQRVVHRWELGRASCRGRVESGGGDGG